MKKKKRRDKTINEKSCKLSNNVDTYSEQCFYKLCIKNEKIKIFYEWQTNKERYIKTIQTIGYDFQNYSAHDKSHSQAIIVAIEKFLGKARIQRLGIGNLWLLLNAAYGHDIGMSIKHEEVLGLWKDNEDFHEYINRLANQPELKLQKEARYYLQLHNLLSHQGQMNGLNSDKFKIFDLTRDWPVHLKKDVKILTNEYIRSKHSDRSKKFLEKFFDSTGIRIAEDRLYKVLGEVAYAHNEDYDYLLEHLKKKVDGFGDEKIHPQFIASLLRLGDLLDMDNNRFDPYTMEHFGEFPPVSQAHLNKHLSLEHLLITEKRIEAIERADDEETCKVTSRWFGMIEEEVKNITSNWNNIAPKRIGGCTFYKCDLQIFLNDQLYKQELHNKFRVDEKKFMDVLIGDKLYDDPFVFMREYIQNAMDATKLMLSIKSQEEWSNNIYINDEIGYYEPIPLNLNTNYLEELGITIEISLIGDILKGERECVRVVFRDRGIGMEEECINALSVIGNSWRARAKYQKSISNMQYWLYPTGGFGIGLQSGFMVTDKIKIKTCGLQEQQGRIITLKTPREDGEISVLNDKNTRIIGTEVTLDIDKERFIECIRRHYNSYTTVIEGDQWNYLDDDKFLKNISDSSQNYIEETIPDCLFPISIQYMGAAEKQCYVLHGKIFSILKQKAKLRYNSELDYIYAWTNRKDAGEKKLCLWSCANSFYAEIFVNPDKKTGTLKNDQFCYRGIMVRDSGSAPQSLTEDLISKNVSLFIDFISAKAEEWLLISRSGFRTEKKEMIKQQGDIIFRIYINELLNRDENDMSMDEAALLCAGMLKYGKSWGEKEKEKLRKINKQFLASALSLEPIESSKPFEELKLSGTTDPPETTESSVEVESPVYNVSEASGERLALIAKSGISVFEIYKMLYDDGVILWEPTVRIADDELTQRLMFKNMRKSYEDDEECTPIEQYISGKLFAGYETGVDNEVFIINDERIAFYLDEYDAETKGYFEIINTDGSVKRRFAYLTLEEKRQEKVNIKELISDAMDSGYSYLVLNDINEFYTLLLEKLPEGNDSQAFCQNNNVLLMPLSPSMLDGERSFFRNNDYKWKDFWKKIKNDRMMLRVVDWAVRHPKNAQQDYSKNIVMEQYKKLCKYIFEILKEEYI